MKLLLLDAGHCLGRALIDEVAPRQDIELVVESALRSSPDQLREAAPDAVICPPLCAPGGVDYAELAAYAGAIEDNLEACRACSLPLVWFVSDQIFEDGAETPIEESVLPAPRDEGLKRLLAVGERIRTRLDAWFIIRTGPLMALEGRDGWLSDILDELAGGGTLRAAEDEIICPTPASAVARATLGMLAQQLSGASGWGAYHIAGVEPVSLYTFHSVVQQQFELYLTRREADLQTGRIQPLRHHHDQPLRRVLNCRRVLETFGVHQKPWRLALDGLLEQWCRRRFGEEGSA
ncbi:sugar nucleotide-binding protein [Kushneria aurantia]|uniref:Sugar nucleotide-binding protein n=1 Tax=Kushneria aurantia TaxID=504092 RepID=A0ABV6G5Q0_9GAMM|nr:sugar nucleotide-binding protein [Kushneria aurantia]